MALYSAQTESEHAKILSVLRRSRDPLLTAEVHEKARFGTSTSIEAVGRRLKILAARGAVRRADYDHRAAWVAVELTK